MIIIIILYRILLAVTVSETFALELRRQPSLLLLMEEERAAGCLDLLRPTTGATPGLLFSWFTNYIIVWGDYSYKQCFSCSSCTHLLSVVLLPFGIWLKLKTFTLLTSTVPTPSASSSYLFGFWDIAKFPFFQLAFSLLRFSPGGTLHFIWMVFIGVWQVFSPTGDEDDHTNIHTHPL